MTAVWLKNITVFNLKTFPEVSLDELEEALATHRFTPCGAVDREQHGFTPVFGQDELVHKAGEAYWVEVLSEQKVVPGAIVKRELGARIAKIEAEEARKVGKKEKKALKEAVMDELLAKALTTQSSTLAVIDPVGGYVLINSTSAKKADLVTGLLINSIDGLELTRPDYNGVLATQMANLLVSEEEALFVADSSLLLKGPGSPAATVRFGQHSLQEPEVTAHLKAGLRPASMELVYDDRLSFVLTDPFSLRKINFLESVQEKVDDSPEDARELLDGILVVQLGEMRLLLADLKSWLQPETAPQSETAQQPEAALA